MEFGLESAVVVLGLSCFVNFVLAVACMGATPDRLECRKIAKEAARKAIAKYLANKKE